MRVNTFVNYPLISDVLTTQEAIKQCIVETNNMMIAAGLLRASDTGQINATSTSTISSVVLTKATGVSTSAAFATQAAQNVAFPPLLYVLNDSFQSTKPVYIRLEFRIAQVNAYNNNISAPNTISYIPYVNVKIGGSTNGASTITSQVAETNLYHTYTESTTANISVYSYHNIQQSYINYNNTKNILNVNICPGMLHWTSPLPSAFTSTGTHRHSLIRFVLKRLIDGSCLIIMPELNQAWSSATNNAYTASKIFYLNGTTVTADSNNSTINTFKQQRNSYINGNIVTSAASVLLADSSMEYDPLILIGSTPILGFKSGVRYDVVINSTETYKYILWSGMDGSTAFDSTATLFETSLLIYDEEA